MPVRFDIAIVGGGIAGASLAYRLANSSARSVRRILLLERESLPGYHATGRSAALYTQAYGNAAIRALTVASRAFYDAPPTGFADHPLLTPRGAMVIATRAQADKLEAETLDVQRQAPQVQLIGAAEARALAPMLRQDYAALAAYEPDAMDMDVNSILQGCLRGAKAAGVDIRTDAPVTDLARLNDGWRLETPTGAVTAGIVVNAAGAWASEVAALAGAQKIEITPKRRTAFLFKGPAGLNLSDTPMVIDVDEQFYFKPDAGLILGSPADETPMPPHDASPDELDIAVGADRIQRAADLPIRRIESSWAGLRSFTSDKTPVVGFDCAAPGFFWFAGQGGYGIQTAPAMAAVATALLEGTPIAHTLPKLALSATALAPDRFSAPPRQ